MDILLQGAVEILPEGELEKKIAYSIKHKKPLIVKQGFDPSAPDLHIGHAVTIRKLKQFQDLGHTVYFIIGDFTGMVGDPSGKSATRPRLTRQQVEENADTYKKQVFKILNQNKTQVCFNSEWLGKLDVYQLLELTANYTVARMLERDDFEKRYLAQKPITILEFLYPLLQAYDSVALKCDIELGGTDQKFNLLLGRQLQEAHGQAGQVVFLMPLLIGTDGSEKMSKSLGNYIGINDPPEEIYGRTMSIPDELIFSYFQLGTNVSPAELSEIKEALSDDLTNPRDLKRRLAREIVTLYYSPENAVKAEEHFDLLFVKKDIPEDIDEYHVSKGNMLLCKLIYESGAAASGGEAKRLMKQGGVKMNGEKMMDPLMIVKLENPFILQVGKKKFVRIIPQ
ncbi:tyrosine--tRNA ligase [bacterium]|nr:tyrosine--tRNA ligase [bacterium]